MTTRVFIAEAFDSDNSYNARAWAPVTALNYSRTAVGACVRATDVAAKYGSASMRVGRNGQNTDYLMYIPNNGSTNFGSSLYIGGWWQTNVAVPSGKSWSMLNIHTSGGAGAALGLSAVWQTSDSTSRLSPDAAMTAVSSAIALNTWYYLELFVDVPNQQITLWIDGVFQWTFTATLSVSGVIDSIRLGVFDPATAKATADMHYDSWLFGDEQRFSYEENWKVTTYRPDADSGDAGENAYTEHQAGGNDGSKWNDVDDLVLETGAARSYCASTAVSQKQLFGVDASGLPATAGIVFECVKSVVAGQHTVTDASDLSRRIKDGSTVVANALPASGTTTATNYPWTSYHLVRPSNSAVWTKTDIDAIQIGGSRGAGAQTADQQIDQVYIEVVERLPVVVSRRRFAGTVI